MEERYWSLKTGLRIQVILFPGDLAEASFKSYGFQTAELLYKYCRNLYLKVIWTDLK
jgi:hypothetical protein